MADEKESVEVDAPTPTQTRDDKKRLRRFSLNQTKYNTQKRKTQV
ncbi:TPA: hypothetical protein ACRZSL_001832 [Campylobacter jejuni]